MPWITEGPMISNFYREKHENLEREYPYLNEQERGCLWEIRLNF